MRKINFKGKTLLCGIVNVTPDSFSDGGKWNTTEKALEHALELVSNGADMLDIGGESTRPGSNYVSVDEEIARIVPVIKKLKENVAIPISVDTWKSKVAEATLKAGADIINDITGFAGDKNMAQVVSKYGCDVVLMFNPVVFRPEHPSCKIFPKFNLDKSNEYFLTENEMLALQKSSILQAMQFYLKRSVEIATKFGISKNSIMLDPGIGFGLTNRENLILIKHIEVLHEMGFKIFLGVSRKRFLNNMLLESNIQADIKTNEGLKNLDFASGVLTSIAVTKKVEVVRVHSIKEHKIARNISYAICNAENESEQNFKSYS